MSQRAPARGDQQALREITAMSTDTFSAASGRPNVNWEADPEMDRFFSMDVGIESLLGYKRNHWTGRHGFWRQRIHPNDRERIVAELQAARSEKQQPTLVYRLVAADDRPHWIHDARVFRDGLGVRPNRLCGCWSFIARQVVWQERLLRERERLRYILELAPEGIVETDLRGLITFVNHRGAAYSGYAAEELIGRVNAEDLVIPEDRERARNVITAVMQGHRVGPREYVALRKDGTTTPVLVHSRPRIADGKPVGLIVVISDLTELKNATAAARASGEQARILLEEHLDAIIMTAAGKIVFCNPALEQLLGLPQSEIIGRSPFDFVHPDERNTAEKRVRDQMRGMAMPAAEYRIRHRDGHYIPIDSRSKRIIYQGEETLLTVVRDCTIRVAAEAALQQSHQHFQEILDTIDDVVWSATPDGSKYHYMNRAAETVYGRSVADFLENPDLWIESAHPEDVAAVLESRDALLKEGRTSCQYRVVRPDGDIRWIQDKKFAVHRADGTVERIVGVAADITESQWLQEKLRQSEEFLRMLLESHPDGIVLTRAGNLLYHNPAVERLTGCSGEQLLARRPEENVHPEDRPQLHRRLEALRNGQTLGPAEYRLARLDGSYIHVEAVSILFQHGGERSKLTVFRDISRRQEALAALERSEARWEAVATNCADSIVILDNKLQIMYMNRPLCPVRTKIDPGGSLADIVPADVARTIQSHCADVWDTGEPRQFEITIAMDDQHPRTFDCKMAAILSGDRIDRIAMAATDVTDRKRIENAIRRHEADLEALVAERSARIRELERQRAESEKQAATGYMAARIAHEINNPLAAIKNAFLLLADAIPHDNPDRDLIDVVRSEVDRIANIVHQMYSIYRPHETNVKDMDILDVVDGVVKLLESRAGQRGVSLEVDTVQGVAFRGVQSHLTQVLFNLVLNGIQASPAGGTVRVSAEKRSDKVVLAVRDDGPGVPASLANRIFEPFFTTADGTSNLGLGLTVSRSYVEGMGGVLTFENRKTGGSEFRVELPIRGGGSGGGGPKQQRRPDPAG